VAIELEGDWVHSHLYFPPSIPSTWPLIQLA
jgi:hypothetical protein